MLSSLTAYRKDNSLSSTIGVETAQKSFKMALTSEELATLIIFQRINNNWAREVHRFESKKKGRKNYVIFRDLNNRKLTSLADLKVPSSSILFFCTLFTLTGRGCGGGRVFLHSSVLQRDCEQQGGSQQEGQEGGQSLDQPTFWKRSRTGVSGEQRCCS